MQSKVSRVVPCYNKVKYIDAFFESVYAQKWDNLRLILDGARDIIGQWESRFQDRGYAS